MRHPLEIARVVRRHVELVPPSDTATAALPEFLLVRGSPDVGQ